MNYTIVDGWGITLRKAEDMLENEVKKLIKDGWIPQGGIAIFQDYANLVAVSQAMIKEEEPPSKNL